jgi:predicted N-formylglutamate amidohydrolase
MDAFAVANAAGRAALALTCEHASCGVPIEYDALGLEAPALQEHIGWDIGARQLTEVLAQALDAPAVLAGVSRLVIDCNRALGDADLILAESHGVVIPGNRGLDAEECRRRVRDFYDPYHTAVDALLASRPRALLLSVHSFTPVLNGRARRFDVGVLFDACAAEAQVVGRALACDGLAVRYNEPYSGLDGLIFSARTHGMRHGLPYLEVEVNNRLLRERAQVERIGAALARAVAAVPLAAREE